MDRKTVKAVLQAYRHIDAEIQQKMIFDQEAKGGGEYRKEARELQEVKREIIRCLNKLPQIERDFIWRHYINGEMWVRISLKYTYSERQVRNIANRGVDRLGKEFSRKVILRRYCQRVKEGFLH